MNRIGTATAIAVLSLASAVHATSAAGQIQASPLSGTSTVIDGTRLSMTFSRPAVRGREVWGGVVRWGGRWTPGANWATVLEVDRDVRINGVDVPAGDYSVWMTPREDRFTISLDPEARIFHAIKPDSSATQIHISAEPVRGGHTEMLTWRIPVQRGDAAVLEFAWGDLSIPLDVVAQPTRPVTLESSERAMFVGTWDVEFIDGMGLPPSAELRIFEENGRLKGAFPFPIHPDDEVSWDLVPAGAGRFNAGLYRGDVLFNVEMGVNLDFDFAEDEDRAVAVRLSLPDGLVWGRGTPRGTGTR